MKYIATEYHNMREIMENAYSKYSNNTAFIIKKQIDGETNYRRIKYSELKETVNSLGTELCAMGLSGERIAVISPNRYEWAASYLAVLNGTGVVVPLDNGLPQEEICSLLARSGATAVIFGGNHAETFDALMKSGQSKISHYICMDELSEYDFTYWGNLVKSGSDKLQNGDSTYLNAKIDNDKMSILLFTSGTTAASKAVMLSHKNLASNIYGLDCCERFYENDVNIAFLPFHHTFGATAILLFLSHGITNVFCDGLRYIAQNLKEYKVTVFVCVPLIIEGMYKQIMRTVKKQNKEKAFNFARRISRLASRLGINCGGLLFGQVKKALGGHVRFIISGASGIDSNVARAFNEFGILTVQGYGLTETAPVISSESKNGIRYGSVGHPMVNMNVKIVNPDKNGIGEIAAKGPNVMLGYYEDKEATDRVIKDGWFYTGDLGYIDKDGFLFITGRCKNVIVLKNGKNVFPEELEAVIGTLPYVKECIVFGYPKGDDVILSVKAVYDTEFFADMTHADILAAVEADIAKINERTANYQRIKKVFVTDEPMEKTTTAKIKRFEEIKKISEM